jgi:hypothetical protein
LSHRIPVADFTEIRYEILKFSSSIEVLSPKELRNEIKNKTTNLYLFIEGKPVDKWHRLEEHKGTVPDLRTELTNWNI